MLPWLQRRWRGWTPLCRITDWSPGRSFSLYPLYTPGPKKWGTLSPLHHQLRRPCTPSQQAGSDAWEIVPFVAVPASQGWIQSIHYVLKASSQQINWTDLTKSTQLHDAFIGHSLLASPLRLYIGWMTSPFLWPRHVRHFVGITWHNVSS